MGKITHKRLLELLHYDPATGRWTWLVRIQRQRKVGEEAGTIGTTRGYRVIQIEGRPYRSNRLAWFYMTKRWPKKLVDHRDLDTGNDAWGNLRLATNGQNKANSRARSDSRLGIKGVSLFKGRYRAVVVSQGNRFYLGSFDTLEAASIAYAEKARLVFGEFARV